jgi:hypothetical protein
MSTLKLILRELPPEAREEFAERFDDELVPRTALRDDVLSYLRLVEDMAKLNRIINHQMAEAIAKRLVSMLKKVGKNSPEFDRRILQAACRYFVLEGDGEDDLDSEEGFDDDCEVMNAVAEHLGREELMIDLFAL